jgi:cytochrome c553
VIPPKSRRIALLAILFASACAGPETVPQGWNAPYPEMTEALRLQGDVARGEAAFVICQGCHRVGALGRVDGSYPRLAGQHATVVIKQLVDVRSGRRSNPKMLPFADHLALTTQEVVDIAAYLERLPMPPDNGRGPGEQLDRGAKLYAADCATCHGAGGEGRADRYFPRLAGQHYRYLLREGRMIRDGTRRNANPEMVNAIRNYSDEDIGLVSDYVSRLPVAPAR